MLAHLKMVSLCRKIPHEKINLGRIRSRKLRKVWCLSLTMITPLINPHWYWSSSALWICGCHLSDRGLRSVSKLFENFGGTLGRKRAVSWANIITKGLSWVFGEVATTRRCVNQQPTCMLSPCPSNRLCQWGWWDDGGFEEDYDVGATASICYWLLIYIYPK